jgi:hypothetical protein
MSLGEARDVYSQGKLVEQGNVKSLDRVPGKATELCVPYGHDHSIR